MNAKLATPKFQSAEIEPIWANPEFLSYVRSQKKFQPIFGLFWPFLPYFTWQFCSNSKNPTSTIYPKPDSDSYW